jgi:hypothetical protein
MGNNASAKNVNDASRSDSSSLDGGRARDGAVGAGSPTPQGAESMAIRALLD